MSGTRTDVEYEKLGQLGQQLVNLRGEFDAGDHALAPLLATISDGSLKSALKDFTNNWTDERHKLVNNLNEAGGFAVAASQAYAGIDNSLAGSMDQQAGK